MADEQALDRSLDYMSVDEGASEMFDRVDQQHDFTVVTPAFLEGIDPGSEELPHVGNQSTQMASHAFLQELLEGRVGLQIGLDGDNTGIKNDRKIINLDISQKCAKTVPIALMQEAIGKQSTLADSVAECSGNPYQEIAYIDWHRKIEIMLNVTREHQIPFLLQTPLQAPQFRALPGTTKPR